MKDKKGFKKQSGARLGLAWGHQKKKKGNPVLGGEDWGGQGG